MSQAVQKRCRLCGKDVANQKRTKDTAGNYYCQPCYQTASARSIESTGQQSFTCPICNAAFDRDGMDESGVCKQCHAAQIASASASATKCSSCGASIDDNAAFCGRCGTKQDDRLSVQDEIDVSFIVAHVRRYAELCRDIARGEDAQKQLDDVRARVLGSRDTFEIAEFHRTEESLKGHIAGWLADCREIATKLKACDQQRVSSVVKLFFENDKVDESLRNGLRRDVLGLFSVSALTAIPPVTVTAPLHVSPTAAAKPTRQPKTAEFMNGIWSAPTRRGTKPKAASSHSTMTFGRFVKYLGLACGGVVALIVLLALTGAEGLAAALTVLLICIGIPASLIGYAVIRGMRSKTPTNAATQVPNEPAEHRQTPIGIFIFIGMVLVGGVLLFLAGKRVFTASPPTDADIHFVVISAIVGIVLLIVGFIGWSSACPNCYLIGTSEILSSQNLGSHIETRRESRVARHYDARGGPAQSETRYDVDIPVTVTTHQHIKHCKKCGHLWSTTSQSAA